MPRTARSLRITDAYRAKLAGLTRRASHDARRWWRQLDWADLDRSYWTIQSSAFLTIQQAQKEAVRMTSGYLQAYLTSELGKPARPPTIKMADYVGKSFNEKDLFESLRTPLIKVKVANKEGQPDPMGTGLKSLLANIDIDVKNAARTALKDMMDRDERIVGWKRAVKGTCEACAGAADGSTLPAGTELDIHPNCECVSEAQVQRLGMNYEGPQNAAVQKELDSLSKQFPGVQGRVRMLEEDLNQLAGVSLDGIHLSPQFFDDRFMAKWASEFRGVQIGRFDSVAQARATVVRHEMGHFLEKNLAQADADTWRTLFSITDEPITYRVGTQEITSPRWEAGNPETIVSAYGTTSRYEFIAESFADYLTNGAAAKESSKRIGAILKKAFGK